jgi:phosphoribosylanthranilate isomerase
MIKVKVCGMKDPGNLKEVSETGPDYVGFIFYPGSPRYIGEDPDRSLFQNVPSRIFKVGVFVDEEPGRVLDIALFAGLDLVQLHGNESPAYCSGMHSAGLQTMKTFSVGEDFHFDDLRAYLGGCDYFLFDTKSDKRGGSGKKFNWNLLSGYRLDKPFFLSGGIGPEDAGSVSNLSNSRFFGVDVNSRFEMAPGIKDVALLKTFIDTVKQSIK